MNFASGFPRTLARLLLAIATLASGFAARADDRLMLGFAVSVNDPLAAYAAARSLGAQAIRTDAPWKNVETRPGQYALPQDLDNRLRAAAAAQLEPLVILDYGNPLHGGGDKPRTDADRKAFADYAAWLVGTLKGRVRYFELWNEWEAKTGGGTEGSADDYLALARATVPRLRQANPQATILSAGMSYPAIKTDYFDRFLAGGGAALFDGLSFHPYAGALKKDWSPERAVALLDSLQAKVQAANGGKPKDFYITEMGYSSFQSDVGYSPRVVGAFLHRFVLLADTRPWIRAVWWYQLRDQGRNPSEREHNFGVLDERLNPKPAALAFSEAAKGLATTRGKVRADGGAIVYQSGDGRVGARWRELDPATGQPFPRNGPDADRDLGQGGEPQVERKSN